MRSIIKASMFPLILIFLFNISFAQKVKLGEVIIISGSSLNKNVNQEELKGYFLKRVTPVWTARVPGTSMSLFQADRGADNGRYISVCIADRIADREKVLPAGSPFTDEAFSSVASLSPGPSQYFSDTEKYTEYKLIGAKKAGILPEVEILGIHYIKIRKDRADDFDTFIVEKLHPSLSRLLPDMGLFYYKAVAGENAGSYITIFAIKSVRARENFWPTGGQETNLVKEAFQPLKNLALELEAYLEEGSYLLPGSGGAAAYFESLVWTDYVVIK